MPANKMPEMPEARFWIVVGKYEGKPELGPQSFFYYGDNGRPHVEAHERQGDRVEALYTADQMRAMYLAALQDARACVPEAMSRKNEFLLPSPAASFNACRETTLANLTALEQEAKK